MLKLRQIRLEQGLSMGQLSAKSGVSRPYISQIESSRSIPRVDIVCRLCKGLDVAPNDLIDEKYWKK